MNINVEELSNRELETLLGNHRRKGVTSTELFCSALRELERRKGLDILKSVDLIRSFAKQRRFLSYKDLAEQSGVPWTFQIRRAMPGHLWSILEYGRPHGWPMLSAIVVNKPNVSTGEMEPETLKGFIAAAHALQRELTDEQSFLRSEQEAVFKWGQQQP